MIPCPPRAELEDLLANRLTADRERLLLAHVETCPACQQTLEELTAVYPPASQLTATPDSVSPWGKAFPGPDTFWRRLKAVFPYWPSTSPSVPAGARMAGGTMEDVAAALPDRLGRYELLEEIGRGGMGAVLRGHDPELGRDLAVKVLLPSHQHNPAFVSRFTEEAQIGGQLQHPGIVPVYEVGRSEDQRPYFTMKLVRGRTLAALLRERSGPHEDLPRLLHVFEQVCQTMAYAHSRGVIHRDLKPSNVMAGAFGEVQVMDWGLAKVLNRDGGVSPRAEIESPDNATGVVRTMRSAGQGPASQPGHVLGTPAYMAPEQASGAADRLDKRCDVFGLGAILCEILTGQPPYTGADEVQVLHKAMRADLVEAIGRLDACGADQELIRLARKSLSAQLSDRPRDAGVLAAELAVHRESMEARLRQVELAQTEARTRAEEERKRQRVKVALAVAGLALVLLTTGGGLWLHQIQKERRAEAQRQEQALRQEVELTLTQAVSLRKGFHFREAQELLEQVRQRLEQAGPDDLRRRVGQARDDLSLAERLDAARLQAATIVESNYDFAGGERKYAAAFAGAGFDWEAEDVTALAARVHDSAVREEIVAGLDDWASLIPDGAHQERLLAVARAADPDRWRDRVRQPQLWRNRGALTKLAVEAAKESELSAQLATVLCRAVRRGGGNALPLLTAAQARFPQDFWINFDLAGTLYNARRWDEAAEYYRAALALRPRAIAGYNNLGVALADKGRLDEAIELYERALRIDPTYAQAHINLGIALKDKGRTHEAIRHYKEALRHDPKLARAHANLGVALKAKGRLEEAIGQFEQALRLDSRLAPAHSNLGAVLAIKGRTDEAIEHYHKALRFEPRLVPAHYNLANGLLVKGRTDEAIKHYELALRFDPRYAPAHHNLGVVLAEKGRLDEAIKHYEETLRIDPKLVPAHTNLGVALHKKGRLDEAIDHYQQVLRLSPNHALAHSNLGIALKEKGRLDEAIRHYEEAIRLDPKYAPAHTNLGVVLADKGWLDEAIKHYQEALRNDPKLVPAHTNLGAVLTKKGRLDEAIEHYHKALALAPRYALAHYNLGNALRVKGRPDQAIRHYEQALRLDPGYALAHNNLGLALATKGRLQEAIGHYEQALRLDPKDALAHANLGRALLDLGRFHEARAVTRRSLDLLTPNHPMRAAATRQLQRCEKLLALESRLLAVLLEGKGKLADGVEYLQFAELCFLKKQFAAAARLSADAFAAKPQLADDVKAGGRYNAACAAARAAAGQGTDAAALTEKERTRLGSQAREWLRADLAAHSQRLESRNPADRSEVQKQVQHWLTDAHLAGVRDAEAIAKLPAEEREEWTKLWAEVKALRKKIETKTN
jgi:tetratricopeptide (TPR) repeat protein